MPKATAQLADTAQPTMVRIGTVALASAATLYQLTPSFGDTMQAFELLIGRPAWDYQSISLSDAVQEHIKTHLPGFPTQGTLKDAGINKDTVGAYVQTLIDRWGPEVELPVFENAPCVTFTDARENAKKRMAAERADDLANKPIDEVRADLSAAADKSELTAEHVTDLFAMVNTSDGITVEGIVNTYLIDLPTLKLNRGLVESWIRQLPTEFLADGGGGWSFLNLCNRADGVLWTGMHPTMEALTVMAIALNKVKFPLPKEMWSSLPGSMPYIVFDPKGVCDA